jgi:hypothetical protein
MSDRAAILAFVMKLLRLAPLACLATIACSDPAAPEATGMADAGPLDAPPVFDGAGDPVVRPGRLPSLEDPLIELADGDVVPLSWAPQGGYFIFVTARFAPFDGTMIELTSELEDPQTGESVRADTRTGPVVLSASAPGFWEADPDLRAAVSHLEICPRGELRDVVGGEWRLSVRVRGLDGSPFDVTASVLVRPSCDTALTELEQALCACYCGPDYEQGLC